MASSLSSKNGIALTSFPQELDPKFQVFPTYPIILRMLPHAAWQNRLTFSRQHSKARQRT